MTEMWFVKETKSLFFIFLNKVVFSFASKHDLLLILSLRSCIRFIGTRILKSGSTQMKTRRFVFDDFHRYYQFFLLANLSLNELSHTT